MIRIQQPHCENASVIIQWVCAAEAGASYFETYTDRRGCEATAEHFRAGERTQGAEGKGLLIRVRLCGRWQGKEGEPDADVGCEFQVLSVSITTLKTCLRHFQQSTPNLDLREFRDLLVRIGAGLSSYLSERPR